MSDLAPMTRAPGMDATAAAAIPPLLEARGLRRSFGATIALDDVSLGLAGGEIHALIGENGSGKSTLIKMLSGIVRPDSGEIRCDGSPVRFADPQAARRAGIVTCFQETLVLEELSVRDNIVLGQDGVIRRCRGPAAEAALARAALAELGVAIDLDRPLGRLKLAQRQLVTIARALAGPWRLLILDESTSALDVEERDRLFDALFRYRAAGRAILFVSHRMDEIARIADRTTVLRSGRSVATLAAAQADTPRLLALMSGPEEARAALGQATPSPPTARSRGVVLRADGIVLRPRAAPIALDLSAGEILGLAGLEGHGQERFLDCIAGLAAPDRGTITGGTTRVRSVVDAARAGIAFLPRDRKRDGIFAPLSVADNLTIARLGRFSRAGLIRRIRRLEAVRTAMARLRVRARGPEAAIDTLSGGNQQKVLLGRLLLTEPRVLALNDPMRGVDPGAKHDLYDELRALAATRIAVLLLSTELPELCLLCDRVAVFRDHAVVAVLDRAALSEPRLIAAMFGHAAADDRA
ncbi:MAG TPA: sugar ABC transporter ATP-binding protein [Acetobacteraceae bacterium]|nr:sugar ABC transporter ATP-binding protein [Acetobacteraceae bacterium]